MTEGGILQTYFHELKNVFNFKGRVSKYVFCQFILGHFCFSILFAFCWLIGENLYKGVLPLNPNSVDLVYFVFYTVIVFFCLFPLTFSISVRRLHDVGKSGWWLFFSLFLSFIYLLRKIIHFRIFYNGFGFWGLCSLLGGILGVVLTSWLLRKGQTEVNKFGEPDEKKYEEINALLNFCILAFFVMMFLLPTYIASIIQYYAPCCEIESEDMFS